MEEGAGWGRAFAGVTAVQAPIQSTDQTYLSQNATAAAAVAGGIYKSGFDQWLHEGADQGLSYNGYTKAAAEAAYLAAHPSVAADIAQGGRDSAIHEFVAEGAGWGRSFAGTGTDRSAIQTADQVYLAQNREAAGAVAAGIYKSGFDQWLHEGADQGLTYNGYDKATAEAQYRSAYAFVDQGVTQGWLTSGRDQFLQSGAATGLAFAGATTAQAAVTSAPVALDSVGLAGLVARDPSAAAADRAYLQQNQAAAAAVAAGVYKSGFDQWLHAGADQGLTYNGFTKAQAEAKYRADYSFVQQGVDQGWWDSGLHQFIAHGASWGLSFAGVDISQATIQSADQAYLAQHGEAAAAVAGGVYKSGLDQWLHEGAAQGLAFNGYTKQAAEAAYLEAQPAVAQAVANGWRIRPPLDQVA